jgi:hypothetical protein
MSQLAASPSRRPAKPVSLLSSRQLGLQWLERSACVLLFFAIWEFCRARVWSIRLFSARHPRFWRPSSSWRRPASWAKYGGQPATLVGLILAVWQAWRWAC